MRVERNAQEIQSYREGTMPTQIQPPVMPAPLADGFALMVKKDCPTCRLLVPVCKQLVDAGFSLTVYAQDDPQFLGDVSTAVIDDTELAYAYHHAIETVPTLIEVREGTEVRRTVGWHKADWSSFAGVDVGPSLPEQQPGCGSKSADPGMAEELAVRFGDASLGARKFAVEFPDDPHEACYANGWSDGLPVVPPTEVRVLRMLSETSLSREHVLGLIPPNGHPCTVEKLAINAVMAGCKPEYFATVRAVVDAALTPEFCLHGLLCTTYFSGPVAIVNGPVAKRIGMNSGVNALGQGNRANATIGRALQLLVRNVGGGVPGGIDRATLGTPGKYSFCFAEDESDPQWQSLAEERGFARGDSTVTLFAGDGVIGNFDQHSRTPESLTRSLAMTLQVVGHPKIVQAHDALLVLSPEHYRVYKEAGWEKGAIKDALAEALTKPGSELIRDAGGVAEGMPESVQNERLTKFRPGGLHVVRAGGEAGLMSAIIGGWAATGERGSELVTKEITQ